MTAKQKSKEIYCKYADALNIRDLQITANPFVKKCALIAVDEVIGEINYDWEDEDKNSEIQHTYWQEVKNEIEKL